MAKVTWTFPALEQLNEIGDYHTKNSPQYARYLIDTILRKAEIHESPPLPALAGSFRKQIRSPLEC